MIYSMKFLTTSSLYFPLWLLIGFGIYAVYGYKQKRLEEKPRRTAVKTNVEQIKTVSEK